MGWRVFLMWLYVKLFWTNSGVEPLLAPLCRYRPLHLWLTSFFLTKCKKYHTELSVCCMSTSSTRDSWILNGGDIALKPLIALLWIEFLSPGRRCVLLRLQLRLHPQCWADEVHIISHLWLILAQLSWSGSEKPGYEHLPQGLLNLLLP